MAPALRCLPYSPAIVGLAVEAIVILRKQLASADARVKILEAELIATRALVDERKVA